MKLYSITQPWVDGSVSICIANSPEEAIQKYMSNSWLGEYGTLTNCELNGDNLSLTVLYYRINRISTYNLILRSYDISEDTFIQDV